MKTIEFAFLPGDTCWVRGQYRECIIENVLVEENNEITYNWYNVDVGVDVTEVWDDGDFTNGDIGKTVFSSLEEWEKAFPEDFYFGDEDE